MTKWLVARPTGLEDDLARCRLDLEGCSYGRRAFPPPHAHREQGLIGLGRFGSTMGVSGAVAEVAGVSWGAVRAAGGGTDLARGEAADSSP